jgi:hypothetical protein
LRGATQNLREGAPHKPPALPTPRRPIRRIGRLPTPRLSERFDSRERTRVCFCRSIGFCAIWDFISSSSSSKGAAVKGGDKGEKVQCSKDGAPPVARRGGKGGGSGSVPGWLFASPGGRRRHLGSARGRNPWQELPVDRLRGGRPLMSAQSPLMVAQRTPRRAKGTQPRRSPIEVPA